MLWIPWVQIQLGNGVASALSKAWDTNVKIERLEITPFSNFKFHGVLIADHYQDTLIYASCAEAQRYDLFAMFNKEVRIGNIVVSDAVFKVQRHPEEEYFNIHFLINFFEAGEVKEPRPEKFKLYFGGAELVNARIHLADTAIGTAALVTCDTGYVLGHDTEGVDMIGKKVWGDIAHLSNANITVRLFDKVTIPNIDSSFWEVPVDSTIADWDVGCEKFKLSHVNFRLINERTGMRKDTARMLDFANLNFNNINLDVDTFRLQHEVFTGHVNKIHGLNHGGFELKELSGDAIISPQTVALSNFKLVTNSSTISHALKFEYSEYKDFYQFSDKVKITGTFDSTTSITFRDIAAFAPQIKENVFIATNLDSPIEVKGKFKGTVNNFRAKNLDIKVHNSRIVGNISMNDVTIPGAAFMDLKLKKVSTDYEDLKKIVSFVNLPKNLATLGQMNFEGSYTGFFQDFVAYGQLDTRLGRINSDLQLNLRKGKSQAAYNGGFKFNNFDIGTFIGNRDVGRITLQTEVEGIGLTLETLDAELKNAKIDSFTFKNYQYEDIAIDGFFKQKKFDGDIMSKDSNMYVFVRGIVDLSEELPSVDILGNVKNIDFQKLNISEESIGLHLDTFDINAKGTNIDNFIGNLFIRGINGHRGAIYSELDLISIKADKVFGKPLYSIVDGDTTVVVHSTRTINLKSDIVDIDVFGEYDVVNLVKSIERFIKVNHPNLYKELYQKQVLQQEVIDSIENVRPFDPLVDINSTKTDSAPPHQDFNIIVSIPKTTKNITQLIDKNFKSLEGIFIKGDYDGSAGSLMLDGKVGKVHVGQVEVNNIKLTKGKALGSTFDVLVSVDTLKLDGKSFIPNINLSLDAIGDSVRFHVNADAVGKIAQELSINGQLELKENLIVLKLDTSRLYILDQKWTINDDNHIKIGDKVLDVKNVKLTSGDKLVELSSLNKNKGALVNFQNINLGWLYGMMEPLPKIEIDGVFSGTASMQNVFNQKGLQANVLIDTLIINDDYWGSNSRLVASADSLKSTFKGHFTHHSDFVDGLDVRATFIPAFASTDPDLQNLLDITIKADGAKAKILEYFLKEQISETEGNAVAEARIFGNIQGKKTVLNIEGDGLMTGVKTKINFLQTKYILSDAKIKMDNKGFHIDPKIQYYRKTNAYKSGGVPVIVEGEPSQVAYLDGSVTHNHLKNFGLDVSAILDNNLAMNTTIEDNSTFYGKIYASGTVEFTGPFERLKLKLDLATEDNSIFNLPIGGPMEVTETNYISFIDVNAKKDSTSKKSIKDQILTGLDIEIIADIKPGALARLIIDEKAGDVIQGRGSSDDMRVSYSPTGELKIFGQYLIEEGDYLFTYKNLINKPFDVKKGGTITWGDNDGDPFKAKLDIEAVYEKNLGLTNLVKESISINPNLSSLANKPSQVNLLMGLKGELFSPEVAFEIQVENVAPALQTPVRLALADINADKNKLNRQVFGIVALQQFLPLESGDVDVVSSGINTGISTLSELVSQQLSLYVNDLLEGVIKDVDFISSLEFDFNFNIRDSESQNVHSTTSNVQLGSNIKFLDDRLTVYAGTNIDIAGDDQVLDNLAASNNYVGGNFKVEYIITKDGQLRIKAYNRTESTILGQSTRTGIGISYRKEFDTLQDLIDEAKSNRKRNKKERYTNQRRNYKLKITKLSKELSTTTDEKEKERLNKKVTRLKDKLATAIQNLEALPKDK
ncbi:MAG: Unknown protein [uncultured Aureispira sp.]|uniref:DUF490 domain-containing protein n=1 Tax=uncultured Aureispira sp. TaxID=1331704 RepID=A0A6S6SFE1_9BACT|nr:MAG: Unknown protein [uncultured Aureispira sp.]